MKRSAHTAVVCAVRARQCPLHSGTNSVTHLHFSCRMTPRIACRSNPIIVAIVILLVAQSTRGFSIHRNPEKTETESTADLAVAESTLLEVKNDHNRPNDIKAFEFIKQDGLDKTQTTDSFKNKFSADDLISKLKNEKGAKSPEGIFKNVPELTKNYSKGNTHITTLIFKTISEDLSTDTTTGRGSKQLESFSNSDVTTSVSNLAQLIKTTSTLPFREITETDSPYTSTQLTSVSATNYEKEELTTASHNGEYNSAGTTVFSNYNLGAEVNTLQDSTLLNDTSYTVENDTESNPTFIDKEIPNYSKNKQHSTLAANLRRLRGNTPENASKSILDIVLTTDIPAEELTKTINQLSTAIDNTSGIIDLIPILNSSTNSTTANSLTSENTTKLKENTSTEDPTSISTTEPTWRKYTVIDRKRLTTPEVSTFTAIEEVNKVGTSPTRISLEEALTITPIASLERLREDLIANKNKLVAMREPSSATDWNLTSKLLSTISTPVLKKTEGKVGMVSSMRAGFLDYSGKATTSESSITEDVKATYATVYDKDEGEIDRMTNKYRNDVESQSQLAEDAIKEELLKEEMINNNEANAQRYRDDRADIARVEPLTFDVKNAQDSQSQLTENKTATEKALQPTQEPGKNLDLYAVNPNYKPMKRIEVQPAKPFVRDPDDNSWRNESISSLGIVFKPKNSSKSFTQVLKNKTEIVLSSLTEKENKNGVPDLRERLEKIAEVRKSKKKRINKFGDTVYTDYEETSGSGESFTTPKSTATFSQETISIKTTTTLSSLSTEDTTTLSKETTEIDGKVTNTSETTTTTTVKEKTINNNAPETLTTPKQKKVFNVAEYYDTTDEYDADYLTLSKIDLKKFTVPFKVKETVATPPAEILQTKPMSPYPPDRKPTIQYFPPRVMPKVKVHDYDENFNRKVNQYTMKDIPKDTTVGTTRTPMPLVLIQNEKTRHRENEVEPTLAPPNKPFNLNKNPYIPSVPPSGNQPQGFVANNGDYNRASYVIKHYGDFINEAAKDDDDRNSDYVVLTEPPIRGITVDELAKLTTGKPVTIDDDYDYETLFRKDILNRFVDNFNQNSERFKVDFPVLYNNSIVHRRIHDNDGGLASSSASMKRLYNDVAANKPNYLPLKKPCEPNCENITVELSPAYELHYYVPDQEEKEVMDPRVSAAQYRLR